MLYKLERSATIKRKPPRIKKKLTIDQVSAYLLFKLINAGSR